MFLEIESWNWICLKLNFVKPHKISTHSGHSDNCYFQFFYRLSDWIEMLWGFTKFFFEQMLKVSVFYLGKQKKRFLIFFFNPLSISKQKSFVYWPNFQWRFWFWPARKSVLRDARLSLTLLQSKLYCTVCWSWMLPKKMLTC